MAFPAVGRKIGEPGEIAGGAVGLTVATIGEAEAFAAEGVTDLFIAYPLWITESKARRLRAVMARAELLLAVDSVTGARQMADSLPGARVLVPAVPAAQAAALACALAEDAP